MKGLLKNNFLTVYSNAKVFSIFMLILGLFVVAVISQPLLIGYVLLSMVGFSVNAITSIKKEFISKWGKYKLTLPVKRATIVKSYFISQLIWLLVGTLYAKGFRGEIITTCATGDLCQIMLRDSAHIQEMEAEWKNRKARRAGNPEVLPLYTIADAQGALGHLKTFEYGELVKLNDDITLRFTDAGHLLGSASIEVWCNEDGIEKKIVFSGDIGNKNKPLIRDPEYIKDADYVVMECTYGDREHGAVMDHIGELANIIQNTLDRGGNVVIPAFAVGRTQELLDRKSVV